MSRLPVRAAHQLETQPEERRWLIEGLWADQAVGIVGGEPKCCKSFLALDMAVAVATGTPCLRHFPVAQTGPVLLFAAEDALHVVRARLDSICHAAGVALDRADIQVITAPSLRLDVEADRKRLDETIGELRPKLLVLDPFVRLHRIDENVSAEVAPLLAHLRELERRYALGVVVVHHARKGAARARAGQALRGSSEFHAWGDSNAYLRRFGDELTLAIEHRAAPSVSGIAVGLVADGAALALQVLPSSPSSSVPSPAPAMPIADAVEQALALAAGTPLSVADLRRRCRARTQSVCAALGALVRDGRAIKTSAGYQLTGA